MLEVEEAKSTMACVLLNSVLLIVFQRPAGLSRWLAVSLLQWPVRTVVFQLVSAVAVLCATVGFERPAGLHKWLAMCLVQ